MSARKTGAMNTNEDDYRTFAWKALVGLMLVTIFSPFWLPLVVHWYQHWYQCMQIPSFFRQFVAGC